MFVTIDVRQDNKSSGRHRVTECVEVVINSQLEAVTLPTWQPVEGFHGKKGRQSSSRTKLGA